MYRRIFATSLLTLATIMVASAQDDVSKTYEDFRKQIKHGYAVSRDKATKEYSTMRNNAVREYVEFRDRTNREYAEFMQNAWATYKAEKPLPKPVEHDVKPVVVPENEEPQPVKDNEITVKVVINLPAPAPQPTPVVPIPETVEVDDTLQYTLYGTSMSVRLPANRSFSLTGIDGKSLSKAWITLSDKRMDNTIRDCLENRTRYRLSDWAYLRMLDAIACRCCGAGTNEAIMLLAYLYCQSGYKMRLATADGRLHLLFATTHIIYNQNYTTIGSDNYFVYVSASDSHVAGRVTDFRVCDTTYPGEQRMSLYVNQDQLFEGVNERTIRNSTRSPQVQTSFTTNAGMIGFANDYPTSCVDGNVMTRWAMYANTPLSAMAKTELYPELQTALNGKSQAEQLQALLTWLHTAFEYEYDDTVWGGDRAFFPEETLYYPYCDCEDRSILYTRLVRDLIGLKTILVYYPGHLACAVATTDDIKGDYIMLDGTKFIVCDPTYVGARIGQTMPGMNNAAAQVILLD